MPKARKAMAWLRDAAEPPEGVELRAADGSTYTGFAVFERSRPVLMLAVRHEPGRTVERPPVVTPPPTYSPRSFFDPEEPRWGDSQYRR